MKAHHQRIHILDTILKKREVLIPKHFEVVFVIPVFPNMKHFKRFDRLYALDFFVAFNMFSNEIYIFKERLKLPPALAFSYPGIQVPLKSQTPAIGFMFKYFIQQKVFQ